VAKFDTQGIRQANNLSDYLPLRGISIKRDGAEWRACCPLHSETTPSFTIYPAREDGQRFHCFGCGKNGDVVKFVELFDGVDFQGACEILNGDRKPDGFRQPASPPIEQFDPYADWVASMPPDDAPPLKAGQRTPALFNPKRPDKPITSYTPTLVHPYRLVTGRTFGYVLRVDIDGSKVTPCILWCRNVRTGEQGWTHRPMREPRRMYGLDRLALRPDAQVLVVEGEKCADAGERMLKSFATVTWCGGGKAASKTDWTPLAGRRVVIWRDADEEGLKTVDGWGEGANHKLGLAEMIERAGAAQVKIVDPPADMPKGWDLADAEAEGWDAKRAMKWARAHLRDAPPGIPEPEPEPDPEPPAPEPTPALIQTGQPKPKPEIAKKAPSAAESPPGKGNVVKFPTAHPEEDHVDRTPIQAYWLLDENNGPRKRLMYNFVATLRHHELTRGVFVKNTFTAEVVLAKRPPWEKSSAPWVPRTLRDNDITLCQTFLEKCGMTPKTNEAGTAIMTVAESAAFDPIRDYLEALKWDGVSRVMGEVSWLERYMGVTPTANGIERVFGAKWLLAAVARNLSTNPDGEKVDTMLIFEGTQGKHKSTALETLATMNGRRYFVDSIDDISSKDAVMQMQGTVIVEIAELNGFGKSDPDGIKRWVSTKVDRIRLPYGKIVVNIPRRCVLAGTVNPGGRGYLRDPTGARRFWPVRVTRPMDIDGLAADRDQLWAEAVHLYRAGMKWWLEGEENDHASEVQAARYVEDAWAGDLDAYLNSMVGTMPLTMGALFTFLDIPKHLRNDQHERRIASHLKSRGYVRVRRRVDGRLIPCYVIEGGDDGN
jgi:predicted P-loop ATPase